MPRALIIDDEQLRHDVLSLYAREVYAAETASAYNAAEARSIIAAEAPFDILFFDNDLGEGGGEGKEVARDLLHDFPDKLPALVIVHSMNSAGPAAQIISLFETYNKLCGAHVRVLRLPFDSIQNRRA